MKHRLRALGALAVGCALALAAPGAASAAPTIANLRVEAGGRALDGGTSYVNDTARLRTAPSQCGGSGRTQTVAGPTAIGLVQYGQDANRRLRPYFVSDRFSFGLIVCRIDGFGAFSANEAWLYKVNHVSPSVGAQAFRLHRGDRVLWYFANFGSGENTGDELLLAAPARTRPGIPFQVSVFAYDGNGRRRPAAGVRIGGSGVTPAVTGPDGRAVVSATREGSVTLRGVRGNDIPTEPLGVCVNRSLDRCPARRGERIVGTTRGDRISGTRGADVVFGRGGNDVIDVRGGGSDIVHCGRGRATVLADRGDRVSRDCARVVRTARVRFTG